MNATICNRINESICLINVYKELRNNFNGRYDDDCPLECSSTFFKLTYSSKNFPTLSRAKHLIEDHEVFNRSFGSNKTLTIDDVIKSVARIRIHHDDTKHLVGSPNFQFKIEIS